MERILLEAKGTNGQIELLENKIRIKRKGLSASLVFGGKVDKEILITHISSIQFKKAGMTNGFIQFSFLGGQEAKRGALNRAADENSVIFRKGQQPKFEAIKQAIDNRIMAVTSRTKATSNIDELEKLASLRDKGIITEDEFTHKKMQFLVSNDRRAEIPSEIQPGEYTQEPILQKEQIAQIILFPIFILLLLSLLIPIIAIGIWEYTQRAGLNFLSIFLIINLIFSFWVIFDCIKRKIPPIPWAVHMAICAPIFVFVYFFKRSQKTISQKFNLLHVGGEGWAGLLLLFALVIVVAINEPSEKKEIGQVTTSSPSTSSPSMSSNSPYFKGYANGQAIALVSLANIDKVISLFGSLDNYKNSICDKATNESGYTGREAEEYRKGTIAGFETEAKHILKHGKPSIK